jgi:hypothetical protein
MPKYQSWIVVAMASLAFSSVAIAADPLLKVENRSHDHVVVKVRAASAKDREWTQLELAPDEGDSIVLRSQDAFDIRITVRSGETGIVRIYRTAPLDIRGLIARQKVFPQVYSLAWSLDEASLPKGFEARHSHIPERLSTNLIVNPTLAVLGVEEDRATAPATADNYKRPRFDHSTHHGPHYGHSSLPPYNHKSPAPPTPGPYRPYLFPSNLFHSPIRPVIRP